MIGTTVLIGGLVAALAVVFLIKFARGVVTTTFAVTIVFIGLFLVVGAPGLRDVGDEVKGFFPGSGSVVYSGESLNILSVDANDNLLLIYVRNKGDQELDEFSVFINGVAVGFSVNVNKLLPGTDCILSADYSVQEGDYILVRSGKASAAHTYGKNDRIVGGAVTGLITS